LFLLFFHHAHGNESVIVMDKAQGVKYKNSEEKILKISTCWICIIKVQQSIFVFCNAAICHRNYRIIDF